MCPLRDLFGGPLLSALGSEGVRASAPLRGGPLQLEQLLRALHLCGQRAVEHRVEAEPAWQHRGSTEAAPRQHRGSTEVKLSNTLKATWRAHTFGGEHR